MVNDAPPERAPLAPGVRSAPDAGVETSLEDSQSLYVRTLCGVLLAIWRSPPSSEQAQRRQQERAQPAAPIGDWRERAKGDVVRV